MLTATVTMWPRQDPHAVRRRRPRLRRTMASPVKVSRGPRSPVRQACPSSAGCAGSRRRRTQLCRRSRPPRGRRHAPRPAKGQSTRPRCAGSSRPAPSRRWVSRIRRAWRTAPCWIIRRVSGRSAVPVCSSGSAASRRSADWSTCCTRGSRTTISCARCSRATWPAAGRCRSCSSPSGWAARVGTASRPTQAWGTATTACRSRPRSPTGGWGTSAARWRPRSRPAAIAARSWRRSAPSPWHWSAGR